MMKSQRQRMIIVALFTCLLVIVANAEHLFQKVATSYYTMNADFIAYPDDKMTIFAREDYADVAAQLITLREQVQQQTQTLLPVEEEHELTVLLLDERDERYAQYLQHNTIGIYFPALNTMMIDSTNTKTVTHTFVHEYAHYLVDQQLEPLIIDEEALPDWFHEGVANYIEFRILNALPFTFSRFEALPYADLWHQTYENAHSIYHQGFYTIARLVHEHGDTIIGDIMRETNETRVFQRGFAYATNANLQRFHEQFIYKQEVVDTLFSTVRTKPEQAQQYLTVQQQKNNLLNQYSDDYLFAQIALAVKAHDDAKINTLLQDYAYLLDRPSIYLRLAELLIWYDESLAQTLLAEGKEVSDMTERPSYEAQMTTLLEQKHHHVLP